MDVSGNITAQGKTSIGKGRLENPFKNERGCVGSKFDVLIARLLTLIRNFTPMISAGCSAGDSDRMIRTAQARVPVLHVMKLRLGIGMASIPRTWPLLDGSASADGIELVPSIIHVSELEAVAFRGI